jgi:hypothetical protein
MNQKSEYTTSSLSLASFLLCSGIPLTGVYKDKFQKKKIFVFERVDGLDQLLELYFRKMARVEPETFFFAIKSLKARLYDFDDGDD